MTPVKRGRSTDYAPVVSMTLGRMRSAGLVREGDEIVRGSMRYRCWLLTEEGLALAEEMFGPAERLAAEIRDA